MTALRSCCLLLVGLWSTLAAASEPVTVAAASSLTEALTAATEGDDVAFTFGSSSRLAQQLNAGMQTDLVIVADPRWMDTIEQTGGVVDRHEWVGNTLVVAGPHPLHNARRIGVGAEGSPIGDYAREALAHWGLHDAVADKLISAPNAAAVLAHVSSGYVDAAIVYNSDAVSIPNLPISGSFGSGSHRPIVYNVGLTPRGSAKPEAIALVNKLRSASVQNMLLDRGFSAPDSAASARAPAPHARAPVDAAAPLLRSVWVAVAALVLSFPPAIGLAWLLARRRFRGKALLNTLCLAPLVLPPVVTGWLLLKGAHWAGMGIAFTPWAAVVAAAAVGFPLLMILIRGAIEGVDVRYEQQAQTLGLTPWSAFRRVTIPMALPGIAAGCVLAFARALGEFGATAMFAGDQPESTRTLALAVYAATEVPGGELAAAQLVAASVLVTLIALLAYERLVWRQRRLREDWT